MTPEGTVIEFPALASEVKADALSWPERARAIRITDPESYASAAELLLGIKALRKRAGEVHDPNIKRWSDGHRAALRDKSDVDAPLTEAERIIKDGMVAWDQEQARIQREAQRLADEAARQREETERLDRAAAMEIEAREYGDDGLAAEAEALIEAPPVPVVAAPIAKATPKVAGITYRTTYSARVTDTLALIRYVAANPQFAALLTPNPTALNAQARSLKTALRIPGVLVVETKDVAAGGR